VSILHYGVEDLLDELIYHCYVPKGNKIKPEIKDFETKLRQEEQEVTIIQIINTQKIGTNFMNTPTFLLCCVQGAY
jgi:uncharacterized protein YeeX (DUF496 family)